MQKWSESNTATLARQARERQWWHTYTQSSSDSSPPADVLDV